MKNLRFLDTGDASCYLVVSVLNDGSASIHGWNDNADGFTGIDLSPGDVAELAAVLAESVKR